MGGTPWLDKPITLHSSREYECDMDLVSQCEYKETYWRFWYETDHRYALPTIALFTATIIVFLLIRTLDLFLPSATRQRPSVRKVAALQRFLSYRAFRIQALNWNSAPFGILMLAAVGVIYFFCMVLAPKPYYWPTDASYGNSPPLATRSGWLSIACMPFVFLTAGKSNFITAVTGVSHEKLQVFHRWISYAFFVTALLHTFPFIVFDIREGTMTESWNASIFYWTGVVALIAQAYLTFASISPLRNISYEWFKFSHFLAALVFMLFFFFHCDYTLTSWDYFIVTGVLFSLSWLHRQLRVYFEHGINMRASVSLTSNGFVQVVIPTKARWQVGQHFFVRFMSPGIHSWTIHPFTACSLPSDRMLSGSETSELVLYIRPRGGLTARLARMAESQPQTSLRVLLDGPYGGVDARKLEQSDRWLVVAGGSGAGWLLPMLSAYVRRQEHQLIGEKSAAAGSMRMILATRDVATSHWFEQAVREVLANVAPEITESVKIEVYFTGATTTSGRQESIGQFSHKLSESSGEAPEVKPEIDIQTGTPSTSSALAVQHLDTRPDLPSFVDAETALLTHGQQLGVFLCGPLSMQHDVQNAVAAHQVGIMKGEAKGVYLHMEHFSWA